MEYKELIFIGQIPVETLKNLILTHKDAIFDEVDLTMVHFEYKNPFKESLNPIAKKGNHWVWVEKDIMLFKCDDKLHTYKDGNNVLLGEYDENDVMLNGKLISYFYSYKQKQVLINNSFSGLRYVNKYAPNKKLYTEMCDDSTNPDSLWNDITNVCSVVVENTTTNGHYNHKSLFCYPIKKFIK